MYGVAARQTNNQMFHHRWVDDAAIRDTSKHSRKKCMKDKRHTCGQQPTPQTVERLILHSVDAALDIASVDTIEQKEQTR